MQVDVIEKGVVTKSLVRKVREFIENGFKEVRIDWASTIHRVSFFEVIEDLLQELYDDGIIKNGKVVCDDRNNSPSAFHSGQFLLEVHFTEKNALKTTRLEFHVNTSRR